MVYTQFLLALQETVQNLAGEDILISIQKVLKNNQIQLYGLTYQKKNYNISPTIYLEKYYQYYLEGVTLEEIGQEVMGIFNSVQNKTPITFNNLHNFESSRSNIAFKLINYEQNKALLTTLPHKPILDLAIVYFLHFNNDEFGCASALIHQSHLDLWQAGLEDLHQAAWKNTPRLFPSELKSMDTIMKEMLLMELRESSRYYLKSDSIADHLVDSIHDRNESHPMYVLTNSERMNGASCMLYENILREFAAMKGSDLYILPSSIHEVILLPCDLSPDQDALSHMLKEVNLTEVASTDRLSNHVYRYSYQHDNISM